MSLTLFSPAKVNLFLRVISRREDGYHNLASLFQAIDLGDTLHLEFGNQDELICNHPEVPKDRTNLIWKAADLFRQKIGKDFKVKVILEKRIPPQAGLGGGSSNAATMLWGLNRLYKEPFSEEQLRNFSAEIGSDIPFFFSSGTAYCTGRGEHVRSLKPLRGRLWIVKPQEGLSTAKVFSKLDLKSCSIADPEKLLQTFYTPNPTYLNDLEKPAFAALPFLQEMKEKLVKAGCLDVTLTGSGTGFFTSNKKIKTLSYSSFPVCFCSQTQETWY